MSRVLKIGLNCAVFVVSATLLTAPAMAQTTHFGSPEIVTVGSKHFGLHYYGKPSPKQYYIAPKAKHHTKKHKLHHRKPVHSFRHRGFKRHSFKHRSHRSFKYYRKYRQH